MTHDEAARAAVDHYRERAAIVYGAWPSPDMGETLRLETAYRILGRAIEAEVFGDPERHHDLVVDGGICSW